ncbi:polysaccharide biosynthesis tyrosine autokinase [Marinobacter qingdaonensis]|uniref:Polysaccharide biosynthesis tyrosine autokinase n=1 Tax=Marinobacter qingdaonensis TaxID=3108486 RepID=A0ABU5P031_9GAMM|nr:polysaccharide biosynthesis tyrosine autokinase [Marinobacter sp. ASW11-75]MEA1081428.1 polysaccharide biosynthesis tyrosine autokinase [Marinobacter sp. ASW11-75]
MTDSPTSSPQQPKMDSGQDDEIDLLALFGTLWDGRWLIISVTLAFAVLGVAYALLKTPIYQANALIQVEDKQGGLPGMENLSGLLESPSNAETEIQLIKSRRVLGKVVDNLNLDIVITPNYFPVVGEAIARRFNGGPGEVAEPLWDAEYAWGGEKLTITRMEVPGKTGNFFLRATESGWQLLNEERKPLLEGKVNEPADNGRYALMVTELVAKPGTLFNVTKRSSYSATNGLQGGISAGEKGRGSGIIALTYQHPNPGMAERILDEVSRNYVRQNIERSSAEAAQSLEFLRSQLPQVKKDLEAAERRLNEYQVTAVTIDITAESSSLLQQIVELETRISELEIQRAEIEQRFQPTHPRYKAWASQMAELKQRRAELDRKIGTLPETQQELVRLRRDVEVGNEIYLQMLSNIQQLDIARAGTVGNVRVVDEAAANTAAPVKPKRALIVMVALLLGGTVGVGMVLLRSAFNRGVENPEDIEKIGLPVYASIPLSDTQAELVKPKSRAQLRGKERASGLLAVVNPADLAIESLRSLRTSLHFGMMDAKNNVLMISGPSPGVGKTFVSVNLAAVMAMGNQKVLLIDGDLRRGFSHDVFRVRNENGLSDLLSGKASAKEVVWPSGVEGLDFVSRGTTPPNPSELLMSKRFDEFLAGFSEKYDLVIIDTPPVLAVTDAAIVGKHAGTTMLVARFGINPVKEIELTKRRFEQNGIQVKGAIFNGIEKKASNYSYGSYGYYNYEYKSDQT